MELIPLLIQLALFIGPLFVCGLIIGRTVEKRHFARLDAHEAANRDFFVTNLKNFPMAVTGGQDSGIVMSEVVIGSDYLKSFLAAWRRIFGGEIRSLQSLQTRAKREAIVRLIDQARQQGFNAICNVRLNSADISGATKSKKSMPMATVFATGTAYVAHQSRSAGLSENA